MTAYACLSCPEGKRKFAKIRGLCLSCYNARLAEVRAGTTTWAELKEKGLAMLTLKELGVKGGHISMRDHADRRYRANGH